MNVSVNFEEVCEVLDAAWRDGRGFLYEDETYRLLARSGAESVPRFILLHKHARPVKKDIASFPGEKAVMKIVSRGIVHKTEVGGVRIIENAPEKIASMRRRMRDETAARLVERTLKDPASAPERYRGLSGQALEKAVSGDIVGVLLCEYMPPDSEAFGAELLVSLRRTREFGMTVTAGLGGTDAELYAASLRPGRALVTASTAMTGADAFFRLFKTTLAYEKLAGLTRGGARVVSDDQLHECFSSFIAMGEHFSPENPDARFYLDELEVNPFAFSDYRMVPLDGICRFSAPCAPPAPRPRRKLDRLLAPKSMALIGASADRANFGRVILRNVLDAGFDPSAVTVIHPKAQRIDGAACVQSLSALAALSGKTDLFIVAVSAESAAGVLDEVIDRNLAETVMLIPGGFGEKKGTEKRAAAVRDKIALAHARPDGGPDVLGGNCLGVRSVPGKFDTIFIPNRKLPKKRGLFGGRSAFISQSGAFLVTRSSRLPRLDPAYMVSIGNQTDLAASDFMNHFADHDGIDVIAVYMEGFTDMDGLAFCRAVRRAVSNGKEIVFYKAGRTAEGRDAAAGHTASMAGDHAVCRSCAVQAGAMMADNFTQFADLFLLATLFHGKEIGGNRLAAVSGAGFEAVGMADAIAGEDYALRMAAFAPETRAAIGAVLDARGLGSLVDVKNPLDINPAADDAAHVQIAEAVVRDAGVDGLVIGLDPLSPAMHTLPDEAGSIEIPPKPGGIADIFPKFAAASKKPVIGVIDGGALYDPLAAAIERGGAPVFRSCDRAVAALAKYIEGRLRARPPRSR